MQEIVTNPMQSIPFFPRSGGTLKGHDRDRKERNVIRRLEQALDTVCQFELF